MRFHVWIVLVAVLACIARMAPAFGRVVDSSTSVPCPTVYSLIGKHLVLPRDLPSLLGAENVYQVFVPSTSGQFRWKTVRLMPMDTSWGYPVAFKDRVFEFAMTVESREEAYAIFRQIISRGPTDWRTVAPPRFCGGPKLLRGRWQDFC